MLTAGIIILCLFSGFMGYEAGRDDCREYKASVQLQEANARVRYLEEILQIEEAKIQGLTSVQE